MARRPDPVPSPYDKIERIVMDRLNFLEAKNIRLANELNIAQAKLDVYERIASISDSKITLGFGPPYYKRRRGII